MARKRYTLRLKPDLLKAMKMLHASVRPDLSFNIWVEMKLEEKMVEEQKKLIEKLKKQKDDPGYLEV